MLIDNIAPSLDTTILGTGHLLFQFVAFGHGVHRCAGAYLAQLEMQALLGAMVARVRTIEVGEPDVATNNALRGYARFRAAFRCAPRSSGAWWHRKDSADTVALPASIARGRA